MLHSWQKHMSQCCAAHPCHSKSCSSGSLLHPGQQSSAEEICAVKVRLEYVI